MQTRSIRLPARHSVLTSGENSDRDAFALVALLVNAHGDIDQFVSYRLSQTNGCELGRYFHANDFLQAIVTHCERTEQLDTLRDLVLMAVERARPKSPGQLEMDLGDRAS